MKAWESQKCLQATAAQSRTRPKELDFLQFTSISEKPLLSRNATTASLQAWNSTAKAKRILQVKISESPYFQKNFEVPSGSNSHPSLRVRKTLCASLAESFDCAWIQGTSRSESTKASCHIKIIKLLGPPQRHLRTTRSVRLSRPWLRVEPSRPDPTVDSGELSVARVASPLVPDESGAALSTSSWQQLCQSWEQRYLSTVWVFFTISAPEKKLSSSTLNLKRLAPWPPPGLLHPWSYPWTQQKSKLTTTTQWPQFVFLAALGRPQTLTPYQVKNITYQNGDIIFAMRTRSWLNMHALILGTLFIDS